MKLVNLIPLKEIDFRNQDAFDAYQKQHQLRPDTKVTIAGKPTTAGQAAQQSKDKAVKGTSVFGGDKGGSVFGGDKPKQINTPFVFKSADSFNAWNKKYKLRPDTEIMVGGEPTTAGEMYKNFPAKPSPAPKFSKKIPTNNDIEGLTSYKDFNKFFKAHFDKFDEEDLPYVEDEMGALKYLESDYKRGDADREEVETAYIDLQDLFKRALSKNDTSDIKGPKPNEKGWSTQDVFNATFKDPETGKTITVGDAYDREDGSPAYQKALAYAAQFDPDDEKLIGEKINIKNEVVKLKNLLPKK